MKSSKNEDLGSSLEGDIIIPGMPSGKVDVGEGEFNTLDEPILETIVSINPHKIATKFLMLT